MKVAKKQGVSSYYTSKGTLGEHLVNLKDMKKMEEKSGIYEIIGAVCKWKYRRQSKRQVLEYPDKSAVAKHCISRRRKIGEMKLIKVVTNWQELNAWESFFIENGEDLLNIEEDSIKSYHLKLTKFKH
jgi:hypothetical protein